jgi:hypothetical protein
MNLAVTILVLLHSAVVLQAARFFFSSPACDRERAVAATLGGLSLALVAAQLVGWGSAVWASVQPSSGADILMAFSFANAIVYLALVTSMHDRSKCSGREA